MNNDTNLRTERLPETSDDIKITRSFRLPPETIDLIKNAAAETGEAQGDIIDWCVISALPDVIERVKAEKQKQEEARRVQREHMLKRGPGRPRKEELKGSVVRGPARS